MNDGNATKLDWWQCTLLYGNTFLLFLEVTTLLHSTPPFHHSGYISRRFWTVLLHVHEHKKEYVKYLRKSKTKQNLFLACRMNLWSAGWYILTALWPPFSLWDPFHNNTQERAGRNFIPSCKLVLKNEIITITMVWGYSFLCCIGKPRIHSLSLTISPTNLFYWC